MNPRANHPSVKTSAIFKLIMGFILCVLTPVHLHAESVLTLDQALDIAVKKSPVLVASRKDVQAADARLTQANAAYLPQVSLSSGYSHTRTDSAQSSTAARSTNDVDSYSAGLSVNQYLYDFGKTPGLVEKSRQSLTASSKNLETTENTLVRDVKQSFFEILKMQQLVNVSQENLELRKRQLDQAAALYKEGMRPRIDTTQAQVQISQAELQLVNARYNLKQAMTGLERLLGGPPMAGPYALAEENPEMQPLPDLDALIQKAVQSRPEIASLQAQIKSAEAGLSSTKRSALPSLSASGSYAKSGEDMPLEDDRWQVSVNLNWPLFTGFRQSGQVAESLSSVEQLKATLANRTLIVTEEVTSAYLGVQSSSEAVKTSQVALQQAKENLSMAQGRYQTGVSDGVELNNAQVLYTESRSSQVQAVYDQYKALAALEFAVGGIH